MAKGNRKQGKTKQGKGTREGQSSQYWDSLKGKPGHKRRVVKVVRKNADYDLRIAVESDGSKEILDMESDGNCLFRSLSDQLFRDHGQQHVEVRQDVCDFMEGHKEEFNLFVVMEDAKDDSNDEAAADFDTYLQRMRVDGEWGGNLELVAAARMYRRDVRVFSANLAAFTVPHGSDKPSSGPDLLLSYHDNDHYNSVRLKKPLRLLSPIRTFVKSDCPATAMNQKNDTGESMDVDIPNCGFDERRARTLENVVSTAENENPIEQPLSPPTTRPPAEISPSPDMEAAADDATKSIAKRPPTRQTKCPCGSGKKYRKCCYARERLELKVASTALGSDFLARNVDMDGTFRILHI